MNLPNLAGLPYLASASLAQKQAAQRASVRITTAVINPTPDITVIDLMCDPRLIRRRTCLRTASIPTTPATACSAPKSSQAVTSASYPGAESKLLADGCVLKTRTTKDTMDTMNYFQA